MLVAALSPGVTVCGRILDMPSFTPWASAPSRWGSPAAPLLPPPPPLPGGGFLGEARASCCRGCGRGGSPSGAKGWCSQVGLVQKPCRFCVARVRNTRFHFCIIIHYYGWATVRERNGLSSAGSTSPSLPVGTAVAGQCIKGDPNSKRVCYMQHVTACTGQSAADYVCCVFSSHPFWTSSSLDVPAGVTQEEGHTGFLIHLPSAVRALIFVARRIQPFLSLVDREVEFCVLTN